METWPQRIGMVEFLKKWWKLLAGFLGAIVLFFFGMRKKNQWQEFNENSKKNLEGQLAAEKIAAEQLEAEREKIDSGFSEAMEKLRLDVKKKKEQL